MFTPHCKRGQGGLKAETVLAKEANPPNPPFAKGGTGIIIFGIRLMAMNEFVGNLFMTDKLSERQIRWLRLVELGELSQEEYELLTRGVSTVAINTGNGAVALSGGVAAGDGGIAIGGNVHGDVYLGEPPKDGLQALEIYRAVLVRSLGLLSLRGLDFGSADASRGKKPLDLVGVYVDLDTRSQKEVKGNDKDLQRVPLPALEAVSANRSMVLLGDPGGGKSTFVNHLAHCLAHHALEPEKAWLLRLPSWPESEGGLLPVVILRDYAGCSVRYYHDPDARFHNFGFRVVVSPTFSER